MSTFAAGFVTPSINDAPPEHLLGLVEGVRCVQNTPDARYRYAQTALAAQLMPLGRSTVDQANGQVVLAAPELRLNGDVVVPDLAAWGANRFELIAPDAPITLAPDWVCDITSPLSAAAKRIWLPRAYAKAGVAFRWIVDPVQRSVEVFRLDPDSKDAAGRPMYELGEGWVGDERVGAEPFAATELDVKLLWMP